MFWCRRPRAFKASKARFVRPHFRYDGPKDMQSETRAGKIYKRAGLAMSCQTLDDAVEIDRRWVWGSFRATRNRNVVARCVAHPDTKQRIILLDALGKPDFGLKHLDHCRATGPDWHEIATETEGQCLAIWVTGKSSHHWHAQFSRQFEHHRLTCPFLQMPRNRRW